MKKRLVGLALAFVCAVSLVACKNNPPKNETIKSVCTQIVDFYLSSKDAASINDLPAAEEGFSGFGLSLNNIRVAAYAKALGIALDVSGFVDALKSEFQTIYKEPIAQIDPTLATLAALLPLLGENPANFCDVDLVALCESGYQALGAYTLPCAIEVVFEYSENAQKADEMINYAIDSLALESGGFNDYGEYFDMDTTAIMVSAMALSQVESIAEYCNTTIELTLDYINDDGTFGNEYADVSSSSSACVLVGISALGIDYKTDLRFVKNQKSMTKMLLEFQNSDGGFRATLQDAPSDSFSSLDVLRAFYAVYKHFETNNL